MVRWWIEGNDERPGLFLSVSDESLGNEERRVVIAYTRDIVYYVHSGDVRVGVFLEKSVVRFRKRALDGNEIVAYERDVKRRQRLGTRKLYWKQYVEMTKRLFKSKKRTTASRIAVEYYS